MKRGFTLLEVIVVLGIAVVVSGILGSIVVTTWRTVTTQSDIQYNQDDLQGALLRMQSIGKQGKAILGSSEPYESNENSIIFQLASINSDQITLAATTDTVVYRLDPDDNTKLTEIVIPDPSSARQAINRTLLKNVSSFSATYYDGAGNEVSEPYTTARRVQLNLEVSPPHGEKPITSEVEISLRNR